MVNDVEQMRADDGETLPQHIQGHIVSSYGFRSTHASQRTAELREGDRPYAEGATDHPRQAGRQVFRLPIVQTLGDTPAHGGEVFVEPVGDGRIEFADGFIRLGGQRKFPYFVPRVLG